MTESKAIEAVITTANGQVGYREGENNYNKYAAELDPLGLTYGPKQNAPWCAEFDLWVFVKCFGADKALEMLCSPKPSEIPLCKSGAQYFKSAGRWSDTPSRGAIAFFLVGGEINHQGIVTNVIGSFLTTVEGNSSDMVARRTYRRNDTSIAGFGLPLWSAAADEPVAPPEEKQPAQIKPISVQALPTLKKGDKGEAVRAAQILLNGRGASVGIWGADGDFGSATEAAVLAFQRRNFLEADGIIGAQTWAALLGVV